MIDADASTAEARRRLSESRAELARLMRGDQDGPGKFPRSRLMKALMSGNGRLVLVGAALAIAIVRPQLGRRLLALAPLPTLARQTLATWVRQ
jgi:hypothetical protein